jgi:Tfp pilus assembly protein PilZ
MYFFSMANKRDCERKIKRYNIFFTDGGAERSGITSNVSCKGLFIRTRKVFPVGTFLNVKLEIDDNTVLKLKGRVRRADKAHIATQKTGMGIELFEIPDEYKNLILKLFENLRYYRAYRINPALYPRGITQYYSKKQSLDFYCKTVSVIILYVQIL